jgi:hypothetical protein
MKRLRGWLLNVLAGLSLLMALTTTAAWIASFWVPDHEVPAMPLWMSFSGAESHQVFFVADRSSVSSCFRGFLSTSTDEEAVGLVRNPSAWFHDMHLLGFRFFYGDECTYARFDECSGADYRYGLGIPVVIAVPLLLVLPAAALKKMRKSSAIRKPRRPAEN